MRFSCKLDVDEGGGMLTNGVAVTTEYGKVDVTV